VLRRRDSGESDRRLTLLTLEHGKIDVVAKGARKGGSRLAGSSEPLGANILHLTRTRKNYFITQVQPQSSFRGLRSDFGRLTLALALVELYDAVLPLEEPLPEAYALLVKSLVALEHHPVPVVAGVWAQLALMQHAGFLPSFLACAPSGRSLAESRVFLSPHAGGYVSSSHAGAYTDRYESTPEVLIGLARTAELDDPPQVLRFAAECYLALQPFWREIAGRALPAAQAAANEVRTTLSV